MTDFSFWGKRTQLLRQLQGLLEDKQLQFELQETKLLSMDVDFMELKTHFMMTKEGITSKNVSFKDPLISSSAMLDRSTMYVIIISIYKRKKGIKIRRFVCFG